MSDWIISLQGTEAGHQWAMILAMSAAVIHAAFGALQKGMHDPWLTRGSVDFFIFIFALPVALFLVPWPQGGEWVLLLGALCIHLIYKVGMAFAYSKGAFTVVYPVVRGTGPLFTVIGAWIIFGEVFAPLQWLGVAVLLSGIFGLAAYNLIHIQLQRETLVPALLIALATGAMVAIYTTYDAYAIRATPNPFTFLAWFFVITAIDFPPLAVLRYRRMVKPPPLRPLLIKGAIGAWLAFGSFGAVMLATRLDKVGEAAVLRETSTVFAALIGWLVLGETVGPRRMALMALIALGAVIVEMGG
ncbi:DMT family transporter [Oceaniglobus ichthyenteri]|uniref:DMT family transporter n=1 Tax=Oceaniglobus ichthyenteri TaxID=2136177 RepID=UPI000D3B35F5|nr:DMT family transporter [Oceaniglobus ichthyenteri]